MSNATRQLQADIAKYLRECCGETGYGTFAIRSEKVNGGSLQIVIDGTPSERYRGNDEALGLAEVDRPRSLPPAMLRTIDDVSRYLMNLLAQIRRKSDGNGGIDVRCRRQNNGKTRIEIKHFYEREIVLRPDEVQASVLTDVAAQ